MLVHTEAFEERVVGIHRRFARLEFMKGVTDFLVR